MTTADEGKQPAQVPGDAESPAERGNRSDRRACRTAYRRHRARAKRAKGGEPQTFVTAPNPSRDKAFRHFPLIETIRWMAVIAAVVMALWLQSDIVLVAPRTCHPP
jgi:hypothetical protein